MAFAFALPLVLLVGDSFKGARARRSRATARSSVTRTTSASSGNSVRLAVITTVATLILGYPAAFALARARGTAAGGSLFADLPAAHRQHHRQDVRHLDHDGPQRHHQLAAYQSRLRRAADPARVQRVQPLLWHGQRLPALHDPAALFGDAYARSAPDRRSGFTRRGAALHLSCT